MMRIEHNVLTGTTEIVPWTDQEIAERAGVARDHLQQELTSFVQSHLDLTARAYGYDDIRAAVSYADEPAVPKFQAEGSAMRAWRSLVWAHCNQVLMDVQSGQREPPTPEQLLAELPSVDL